MLQQQWPWLTPSARRPAISSTLRLYMTSKIVSPCWCTWVVHHWFVLKEKKKCELLLTPLSPLPLSNTDLAIVFFSYSRDQVGYYILSWCWWWSLIYSLFKVPSCLPVCAWKECWQNGGCDEDNDDGIRSVWVCCSNVECFFLFDLSMRDSCSVNACVCLCVRAFEHLSASVREVNRCLSDSLHLR